MTATGFGMHIHRFNDNPREREFAKAWKSFAESNLKYLLCVGDQRGPVSPSDRDFLVAATVIQWLGSPVGQGFLRDLGYSQKATP